MEEFSLNRSDSLYLEDFYPVRQFQLIKALSRIPMGFKSQSQRVTVKQQAFITALKLSKRYGPEEINQAMLQTHV